jgi:hypothetical protein
MNGLLCWVEGHPWLVLGVALVSIAYSAWVLLAGLRMSEDPGKARTYSGPDKTPARRGQPAWFWAAVSGNLLILALGVAALAAFLAVCLPTLLVTRR